MKAAALLLMVLLAGCQTAPTIKVVEPPKVATPANVAEACDPLPAPPGKGSTFGDVYTYAGDLVGLYGTCASRDAAKLQFLRSQGH